MVFTLLNFSKWFGIATHNRKQHENYHAALVAISKLFSLVLFEDVPDCDKDLSPSFHTELVAAS